jgi:uncharacterized protein (DUF58 family)
VPLIPAELLKKLSKLKLRAGARGVGMAGGERRSIRRGQSLEFADHRPYVPGDDLRHLDWHLYGRLDQLWLKLFEESDDRVVQAMIDTSASMQGEKLDYARQLAAALAWVALGHGDRVAVAALSDRLAHYSPPRRGRGAATGLFRALEQVHPDGRTDLARAVAGTPRQRGNGVVLLFTDMLYADGPDAALKQLRARGNEVHAFHLISPTDLRPDLSGDVVLVDAETGDELPLSIDDDVLDTYEATVWAWAEEMRQTCSRLGVGYTRLITSAPIERVLLDDLRRQGLLG